VFRKLLKDLYHNDPLLWRLAIEKFRRQDKRHPPPTNAILFTGSSSIRFWSSLEQDMAPYTVINRGFGGSMIHQVLHFAEEIIVPYQPAGIFLYAGENDIAGLWFTRRHSADEVCENFQEFWEFVQHHLPDVPVHYISIKPAKGRQKYWPEMQRANRLIEQFCETDKRLRYIDIVPVMQTKSGDTRTELFTFDGVHMNEKGYAAWTRVIRPYVEAIVSGKAVSGEGRARAG